ncbi:MAG: small ribosomal subunit biogenesis GTPase RsgA [Leptolyngbya sp. SIO4C1]|nr:small ribosomal subunit biogenesis GTPase RsgA [Leptolyngbya sp. SIO4C1]
MTARPEQQTTEALPSSAWGTVTAGQANFYWVQLELTEALAASVSVLCTRRARLKKLGQQVLVGDRVQVEELDWLDRRGAIAAVAPRKTTIDRPPIANVDQILLVFALAEPALDALQLSRFLVKAESTAVPVTLCLNKRDLISPPQVVAWQQRLAQWGYAPVCISLRDDWQLPAELIQQLQYKISVVAGPSGVGKSSLINRLIPDSQVRTGAVSGKLGRGRHTTRHVELFELPTGGFLADTPGFNQPDITCTAEALGRCFPEIRARLAQQRCQFRNCLHRDEPGCAVRRGDWERYDHYLLLLEEALQHEQKLEQSRDEEAAEKIKMGEAGTVQHEPKLEAKKYRRTSRRSRNQNLQELRYDLSAEDLDSLSDSLEDETLEEYGL